MKDARDIKIDHSRREEQFGIKIHEYRYKEFSVQKDDTKEYLCYIQASVGEGTVCSKF